MGRPPKLTKHQQREVLIRPKAMASFNRRAEAVRTYSCTFPRSNGPD
jgi:hypothetical protein